MQAQQEALSNGPAAAAILAASIGSLALGLCTAVAQAIVPIKNALNLYDPVGPLSGKTTAAVVVWLIAWTVLHARWKNRQVAFARLFTIALILIALGVLGTFPVFFELFGG